MKAITLHRKRLKLALEHALTIPSADTVEMRYRTLRYALLSEYPNLINGTDKEVMLCFLKDVCFLDRALRKATEGKQVLEKKRLSQEYQMDNLNYEANYHGDVKQLKKI